MEDNVKLLDCPFCGSKAYVGKEYFATCWTIGCSECFCLFERYFNSKEEAIKKWNERIKK